MSQIQAAVEWMLEQSQPFTVKDAANAAKLNATTATHACRALEAAGVLRKCSDSAGRHGLARSWTPHEAFLGVLHG